MVDRSIFHEEIEKMQTISSRYQTESFQSSCLQINTLKDYFDIKVIVVGHFSAGKSALLNTLIGRTDFLTEQQRPETAIASELHYSEDEHYTAVNDAGEHTPLNSPRTEHPEKYSHLEFWLPSDNLKELSDFTIVDTPGFDSGIENHNKALSSYLGFGSAYLLIIDIEKGGIDKVSLRFLDELSNYSSQAAVILNKCDKQIPSNIEKIKAAAEDTLENYGYDCPVYCTSKYDPETAAKLVSCIQDFQAQKLFNWQLSKKIVCEAENALHVLQIIKSKQHCNTYDLDVEIHNQERAKEQFKETLAFKKQEITDQPERITTEIINQIRGALQSKSDAVAEAALNGGSAAIEAIMIETIRPVIISNLKRFSSGILEDIMHSIDFTNILGSESSEKFGDIIKNLIGDTQNLIDNGVFGKIMDEFNKNKHKKAALSAVYHAVTGVAALTTSFIAPWLEAIIVFLPDAINLIRSLFGQSDREKLKKQYEYCIIPQVTSKMYNPVEKAVQTSTAALLNNLETTFEAQMETVSLLLNEAKEKKENQLNEYHTFMTQLEKDITDLQHIADTAAEKGE